jgi:hypothetical protein
VSLGARMVSSTAVLVTTGKCESKHDGLLLMSGRGNHASTLRQLQDWPQG